MPRLILNPSQMPAIPPTVEKMIEENEKASPPHSAGMKLPAAEPIHIPIQISDFDPIV